MQGGALLVALGAGYTVHSLSAGAQNGTTATPPTQETPVVHTTATNDAASTQKAFVDVADAVEPAVVTIVTTGPRTTRTSTAPGGRRSAPRGFPFGAPAPDGGDEGAGPSDQAAPGGSDFQEFFKKFQRDFGLQGQSYQPNSFAGKVLHKRALIAFRNVQERGGGLGSGMIYRADGLILTNAHVVRGANVVSVKLADGRTFDKARVLGRDERTDIAVVKINATGLPTVKLGDSDETRVGDWAIAVGNPFGLDHTLTVGVISARSRELNLASNGDSRTDYLQTDASINPGNSGGPLLDIYGRVVGINNAIYSESGGNQGIGFAIPVNTARLVADQIASGGRVRRGYLGVKIRPAEDVAQGFGLDRNLKGVLVDEVTAPNGPGAKAGLQAGDIITHFNGQEVSKSNKLQQLVGNSPIGSTITLDVIRDGKTIQLKAVTQELEDTPVARPTAPDAPEAGPTNGSATVIPGLKTRNLSADVARALGIKATRGVVVTQVDGNSAADDAGLQRGDVIERVASTSVATVAELNAQIARILGAQSAGQRKVTLYVNRGGQRTFVVVTTG